MAGLLSLGDRIKRLRKKRKMTQRELAAKVDMAQSDLWRIESGETKNPHWHRMIMFADALGVSLDELAGRNGANKKG